MALTEIFYKRIYKLRMILTLDALCKNSRSDIDRYDGNVVLKVVQSALFIKLYLFVGALESKRGLLARIAEDLLLAQLGAAIGAFENLFALGFGFAQAVFIFAFERGCVFLGAVRVGVKIVYLLLAGIDHVHNGLEEKLFHNFVQYQQVYERKKAGPEIYAYKALKTGQKIQAKSLLSLCFFTYGSKYEEEKKSDNERIYTRRLRYSAAEQHVGAERAGDLRLAGHALESLAYGITFADSRTDGAETHAKTCAERDQTSCQCFHLFFLL